MKSPATEPKPLSAAKRLRIAIEAAEADGAVRDDMTLRLTFGDVSQLKRDGSLALEDISFVGGVMRYLGVRIEQGGVAESVLKRPASQP